MRLAPWCVPLSLRKASLVVLSALALPSLAAAQASSATTPRELIDSLFVSRLTPGRHAITPEERDLIAARADQLSRELAKGIAIGISTAPVGGSAAGFSYELNTTTGELVLRSSSFGPLLMDRPLTNGAGVLGFGFSFQRLAFDELQGVSLRDRGYLAFDNQVLYTNENLQQYIQEFVQLEPTVTSFNAVLSYGLTGFLDLGVVVPIHHLELEGRRQWDWHIPKTYPIDPRDQETFDAPSGEGLVLDQGSVSATGVGDLTVRAKVGMGRPAGGLGVLLDLRLPTGDEENLLGTGEVGARLAFLGAKSLGDRGNAYVNAGYSFGGLSDEVNYAFGIDTQLLPAKQLTLSFEVLGQNIRDFFKSTTRLAHGPVNTRDFRFTPPEPVVYDTGEPILTLGSVNSLKGAVGAKYQLGSHVLLTGGVVFPLNDKGLQTKPSPYVGLDFAWARLR